MATKKQIVVMGDGGWGTALALLLCGNGHKVHLWGAFETYVEVMRKSRENKKFLPGVKLPKSLVLEHCMQSASANADLLVAAAPTQFMRSVCERVKDDIPKKIPVVNVSKGVEEKTGLRNTQIIRDVWGVGHPIAALSGPSHAEEVARKKPCSVAVASKDQKLAKLVQKLFFADYFRVYTNDDPVGVELGGALKNVIALAAGMCDGLGIGDNAKSALLTRGLVEMTRFGQAHGAKAATFRGLSGIGDLMTTCFSPHGRNRAVGEKLGSGKSLKQILASTEKVAEGVWTTRSVQKIARAKKIPMPITEEIYKVLFKNKSPRKTLKDLMTRDPRAE